ncbi:MAG TPA: PorP/SprF family type IX secretion system membrane protein [Saprospiraceae bacterium]|nr:PorP/SprF family type IX secretion system membrane protein [Saprospiraceae bacterium]
MPRIFFILLGVFLTILPGLTQDVSYSQFNAVAPYYNPAFTSAFSGNYKVSAVHRSQWIGFQDQPISSFCVMGDIKFDLGIQDYKDDYFGAAVYFATDRSRLFDWNNNEIALMLAYHRLLEKSNRNYLSLGFGIGVTQRSLNYDQIYFEDQFDGLDKYNGSTSELLPPNIYSRPELKFGVHYNTAIRSSWRIQSGIGLHYILRPELSFYHDFDNPDYTGSKSFKSAPKLALTLNGIYHINSYSDLYPRILLVSQGPHQLLNAGLFLRKSFYSLNQTALHTGLSSRIVRTVDGISPSDIGFLIGFEIRGFVVGMHYDIGIKDAVKYASPSHSFEISLSLLGNYENEGFICPSF